MKASLLLWLCLGASALALTPEQVEQLKDAKKQFEAGLITQPIYEDMQRKILDLPAAPSESPANPKSAVLDKLTTGYWRLSLNFGSDNADDGPVLRFAYRDGKLRMTRFKRNYADEPGRSEDLPVSDLSIQPKAVSFSYLEKKDDKAPSPLTISLGDDGKFKVEGLLSGAFRYKLTPAPVHTDAEWEAWYEKNDANKLLDYLGTVSEIWRPNGEPDHQIPGACFLVWYNAVQVERNFHDDFVDTLRPLILKLDKSGEDLRITQRFDYMNDAWVEFPTVIREKSYLEYQIAFLAEGKMTEAQWREGVQKVRALNKERGIRPKWEMPLKDGGIRRGASPHVSADDP